MWSPGTYHRIVPKDPAANMKFRRWVLSLCQRDRKFRAGVMEACRQDFFFFCDLFVWQFNPNTIGRLSAEVGPFVCWDFQHPAVRKILDCIWRRKDLVIDKSREMGASWLCLIVMVWFLLFHKNKKFLCVSKDEESVDSTDEPDSLFWKVQYILGLLPDWMKRGVRKIKNKFANHRLNSFLTGIAQIGGKIGVGGRATAIFLDEFSLFKEDRAALNHTANTAHCRIINGTHRGTGTALFDLTNPEDPASSFVEKLQMHWSLHPEKVRGSYHYDPLAQDVVRHDPSFVYPPDFAFDTTGKPTGGPFPGLRSPWYDEMCRRIRDPRAIAMDLDIDPQGSVGPFFEASFIRALVHRYSEDPVWVGDVRVAEEGDGIHFVERHGGPLRLWFRPEKGGKVPPAPYVFGCDIAQGVGSSPSCSSGVNAVTGTKVWNYVYAHIEPTPFANLMVAVCKHFKDGEGDGAWLAWEKNGGPGALFTLRVRESGYHRLYYPWKGIGTMRRQAEDPGWDSEAKAKNLLLIEYRDGLQGGAKGRFLNRDRDALLSTLNFNYDAAGNIVHAKEKNDDNPGAGKINHGDIVIADALAWRMACHAGRLARPVGGEEPEEIHVNSLAWRVHMSQNSRHKGHAWARPRR